MNNEEGIYNHYLEMEHILYTLLLLELDGILRDEKSKMEIVTL